MHRAPHLASGANEFGARHDRLRVGVGPHTCPGQHLAKAIVEGIVDALDAGNYRMLNDLTPFNDAGRPTTLPMEPERPRSD